MIGDQLREYLAGIDDKLPPPPSRGAGGGGLGQQRLATAKLLIDGAHRRRVRQVLIEPLSKATLAKALAESGFVKVALRRSRGRRGRHRGC